MKRRTPTIAAKRGRRFKKMTPARLLALQKGRGFVVLVEYLDQYDSGEIPHNPATDAVAAAFNAMLDGIAPAAALNLQRKGRRRETIGSATFRRRLAIAEYILDELDKDTKRGRVGRAMVRASVKFRVSEVRARQIWDEMGDSAQTLRAALGPPRRKL